MSVQIQLRRDTAANWASVNPILADGEMGVEKDTLKFKFGNGVTNWNDLVYASGASGEIPTKLSQLENDVDFITIEDVEVAGYTKNVGTVVSVNDTEPDENGNVSITIPDEVTDETVGEWGYTKNTGTVTSVNSTSPDANGNVTISIPDEVTETTVTNWGFTKNAGTVTSVNNTEPQNGNVTIAIPPEVTDSTVSSWGYTKNTGTVTSVNSTSPDTNGNVSLSYQEPLVSGTNIKTINNQSLLGSGNINISGGGGDATWGSITGTLSDQTDLNTALSAKVEGTTAFSHSEIFTELRILETLDAWIYTNSGATGNTAVIKPSTTYKTIRCDVSEQAGENIHIYTKWHSQDLQIPIIFFIKDGTTIISRVLYSDYTSSAPSVITVDQDFEVPADAEEVWVACNKSDVPLPSATLATPRVETVSKTLNQITDDYLTTICTTDDLLLIPTNTYDSYFNIENNILVIKPASDLYSTNQYTVTADKDYHITTEWQSGDVNTYIVCFTDDECNPLLYKQYKDYGSGKVVVSDTLTAPTNATRLYVSWRNEFNKATCKQLANGHLHALSLNEAIDKRIAAAGITPSPTPSGDNTKSINILFIGNSLTQDGVSYVPWILKRLYPDIQFKFWMWYCGGYQLYQHLAKFQNHQTCEIGSYTDNTLTGWTNYSGSKTIDDMLGSGVKFDVISIQEYFTYKTSYGADDLQVFMDTLGYIADHYAYPYHVAELFHQPHLTQASKNIDVDDRFEWQVACTQMMWDNLPIQSIIPTGFASYRATKTALNSLGSVGGMSPDYTHSQEGLPCQMLAWVTTQWILRHIGYPTGMYNDPTPITQAIYNTLHVPGANGSLVTGTTDQYRLAQKVAMNALKECDSTFKFTYPGGDES